MRTLSKITLTAAAVLLWSCSVYKEYERPENIVPDNLYNFTSGSPAPDSLCWRDFFTDPLLQNLIEEGLENNTDLQNAAQKVIEARSSLRASGLAYLPNLGFSPTFKLEKAESGSEASFGWNVPGVHASWEIDLSGRLFNNRRISRAALEEALAAEQTVRTELVAAIAESYYNLEMLDAQLAVSRTTAKSWKENVRIMKSMKDAGMTNAASVSQTEANSCSIDASLFDLEYRINKAENELAMLLGVPYRKFERGDLKSASLSRELSAGVPMDLLAHRPDVRAAEAALRKAGYNTALAHSAFYPSLTLTGDYGWQKALANPAQWILGAAAGLTAPVFNGGRNRAALKSAQARETQALNNFRQAILNAGGEVNDAVAKCRAAEGKKDLRENQIDALEQAVESTQALMRHSESTYLEVLTAQQSLLSAKLLQISDSFDNIQGIISLYRALGGE